MSMEGLVAALYGIHEGTAASAILTAYKTLQKPALAASQGHIDLAELDTVIAYLIAARERLGGVSGAGAGPGCPVRSAPADGNIRCIRLDNHGGDHWFAMAWDGNAPERSMKPIRVTAEELPLSVELVAGGLAALSAERAACTCGVGNATLGEPHEPLCPGGLDPAHEAEQDMIQAQEEPVDGEDYR